MKIKTKTKKNNNNNKNKQNKIRHQGDSLLRSRFFGMSRNAPPKFLWGERCVTSQNTAAKETTREGNILILIAVERTYYKPLFHRTRL